MNSPAIRVIAICLMSDRDRFLVFEEHDSIKQDWYCRPLGGGVEFSESSEAAVKREFQEELGEEITDLKLLGVLENIFRVNERYGHEVVFVYDGRFVNEALYNQVEIPGAEPEIGATFTAVWRTREELRELGIRLVPEGLGELMEKSGQHD